jgi:hypothetical protein
MTPSCPDEQPGIPPVPHSPPGQGAGARGTRLGDLHRQTGGSVRLGVVHRNAVEEVDRAIDAFAAP